MEKKCFVCEEVLQTEPFYETLPDHISVLYAGTIWRTTGNYGSTIFDPFDSQFLEAYVCDGCLVKKRHLIIHAHTKGGKTDVKPY